MKVKWTDEDLNIILCNAVRWTLARAERDGYSAIVLRSLSGARNVMIHEYNNHERKGTLDNWNAVY